MSLYQRACRVIPGGVDSPVRAFGSVGGDPVFIARASGPYLYDTDGREYVDAVGSWGPALLGHAHPEVVSAVQAAAARYRAAASGSSTSCASSSRPHTAMAAADESRGAPLPSP